MSEQQEKSGFAQTIENIQNTVKGWLYGDQDVPEDATIYERLGIVRENLEGYARTSIDWLDAVIKGKEHSALIEEGTLEDIRSRFPDIHIPEQLSWGQLEYRIERWIHGEEESDYLYERLGVARWKVKQSLRKSIDWLSKVIRDKDQEEYILEDELEEVRSRFPTLEVPDELTWDDLEYSIREKLHMEGSQTITGSIYDRIGVIQHNVRESVRNSLDWLDAVITGKEHSAVIEEETIEKIRSRFPDIHIPDRSTWEDLENRISHWIYGEREEEQSLYARLGVAKENVKESMWGPINWFKNKIKGKQHSEIITEDELEEVKEKFPDIELPDESTWEDLEQSIKDTLQSEENQ